MILALGLDPDVSSALRSELNRHGEEAPDEAEDEDALVAGLNDSIELVVLGPRVADPLAVAQRLRLVDRDVAVACIVPHEREAKLSEAARITPFLGGGIAILAPGPGAMARVRQTLLAARQRVLHRATLAAMNVAVARPATPLHARSSEHLDRLMVHLPLGILVLDDALVVRAVNPHARDLLGIPASTTEDPHLAHLFPPGALPDPLPDGAPFLVRRETARGAQHLEVIVSRPRTGARGAGHLVILRDVTERVRQEAELRAARRQLAQSEKLSALGSLVAGVAHEVRTPLAYIANSAEVLARLVERLEDRAPTAEEREDARAMAAAVQDGVQRIDRLVQDLRRFTRSTGGEQGRHRLDDVVRDALDLFRAAARQRSQVRLDLEATEPLLMDPLQVQQVVINLLDNAADAMEGGGLIEVGTRPVEGGAELVVADSGPGIPQALLPRIFDPLFTTKREGTGLGLAIVHRIVQEHGGRVSVESGPGGARFSVFLPRGEDD